MERGTEVNVLSTASAVTRLSGSVARGISSAVGSAMLGITGLFRRPSTRMPLRTAHPNGNLNLSNMPQPRTSDEFWNSSISQPNGNGRSIDAGVQEIDNNTVAMGHAEVNGTGRTTPGED